MSYEFHSGKNILKFGRISQNFFPTIPSLLGEWQEVCAPFDHYVHLNKLTAWSCSATMYSNARYRLSLVPHPPSLSPPPYLVLGIEEYFWRLNLSATPRGRFIPVSYCWHQLISTAETTLVALPERSNRNCKRFLENCIIKSHSQTTTQPHSWATTQSHSQVTSQHTLQGG